MVKTIIHRCFRRTQTHYQRKVKRYIDDDLEISSDDDDDSNKREDSNGMVIE